MLTIEGAGSYDSEKANEDNGYVRNCIMIPRDGDRMFVLRNGRMTPMLDGYAVIPRELFEKIEHDPFG